MSGSNIRRRISDTVAKTGQYYIHIEGLKRMEALSLLYKFCQEDHTRPIIAGPLVRGERDPMTFISDRLIMLEWDRDMIVDALDGFLQAQGPFETSPEIVLEPVQV